MQRINYTEAEQLWVLDELTSLMVSNITDVSFVDGDLAWCGHLRPSLSLFVVDIDLRVIGLLNPRGRGIFMSKN